MVAFPYRLPIGFAGQVTRPDESTIEANKFNAGSMPQSFGHAVVSDANGIRAVTGTDVKISGFLVRPYPTSGNGTDGLGTSTPISQTPGSVMKRGYMTVKLGGTAAAVKDGLVYVRLGNPSTGKVVGDVEAAPDNSLAGVAKGGNTGNGTMSAVIPATSGPGPQRGVYKVIYSSATAFQVFDPNDNEIGTGVNGTVFNNEINFTMTAGGAAFVSGDEFDVTSTFNTLPLPGGVEGKTYFTGPADSSGVVEIAFNL